MEYAASLADIVVSATGNLKVITQHAAQRSTVIVCNIGHFDNEIDVASLRQGQWANIKPRWTTWSPRTAGASSSCPSAAW